MDRNVDLAGIWVALVTPFLGDAQQHRVDHAALAGLVAHLKQAGVTGFVALGSTGEASALDDDEQDAVLGTVLETAAGTPVIAGLAAHHVGHLHRRLAAFNKLPLKAVLSAAPSYVRPSQTALVAHFRALADASAHPLVLYDIPYRTGVQMTLDTLLTLASHPHIVGIKDCGGSPDKTQTLIADGRLQVLSGEDHLIFHNLCLGGAGAITAAAQIRPAAFMAMFHALRSDKAGSLASGRRIQHVLLPLLQALFAEPNPSVVKAALHGQGLCERWTRPPMLPATEGAADRVTALLCATASPLHGETGANRTLESGFLIT